MEDIIELSFGENNKIKISEIESRVNKVSEEERRIKGDLQYRLSYQSDGFQVSIKVRDLFSGIQNFKTDLEKMSTQLEGNTEWYNSDIAGFGTENNFRFSFQMVNNGKINLTFEINSKNTELQYNGEIDQTYLLNWINEIDKLR